MRKQYHSPGLKCVVVRKDSQSSDPDQPGMYRMDAMSIASTTEQQQDSTSY
uniref:Bm10705 n=1 Tax=Brugia malayi TaxID=6279 RepID=A0A1I9G493_BRUMA|nr:Bm10705 [Brugia malayi]